MGSNVDNRIVEMQFDNKQFEQGVATTIKSLDTLKTSLDFSNVKTGLDKLGKATRNVDMSSLQDSVEHISKKFTVMGIAGVTAIQRVTNAALTYGKNLTKALTISPIKTGLDEYETKMQAIQTIWSNTRHGDTVPTMKEITDTLEELNRYADKTIYNFAQMTRNIGTFTAAGLGLEESAKAIQGIANLAAASGSTSQQASMAMYQLSQALASGTVRLMDWNSVVNAGMGGKLFQNALIETAKNAGVIVDTTKSFRDTLQSGWLTSKILMDTLQKFAEDKSMEAAATHVKTFTHLIDTMKESVQSGWAQTWEAIIGNKEQAEEFFTNISNGFNDLISESTEHRNKLWQAWNESPSGRKEAISALADAWKGLMAIVNKFKDGFREVFPRKTSDDLLNYTKTFRELATNFRSAAESATYITPLVKAFFSVIKFGMMPIKFVVKMVYDLSNAVLTLLGDIKEPTKALTEFSTTIKDIFSNGLNFKNIINNIKVAFSNLGVTIDTTITKLLELLGPLGNRLQNVIDSFKEWIKSIDWLKAKTKTIEAIRKVYAKLAQAFQHVYNYGKDALAKLPSYITKFGTSVKKYLPTINTQLTKFKDTISNISEKVKTAFTNNIIPKFNAAKESIKKFVEALKNGSDIIEVVPEPLKVFVALLRIAAVIVGGLALSIYHLGKYLWSLRDNVKELYGRFKQYLINANKVIGVNEVLSKITEKVKTGFDKFKNAVLSLDEKLKDLTIEEATNKIKELYGKLKENLTWDNFKKNIKSLKPVLAGFLGVLKGVISKIDIFGYYAKTLNGVWSALTDGFRKGASNELNKVNHTMKKTNGILYNLGYLFGILHERVKVFFSYMKSSGIAAFQTIKNGIVGIALKLNDFIRNNYGVDIIQKFKDMKTKVVDYVNDINTAIKDKIGIDIIGSLTTFKDKLGEIIKGFSLFGTYEKSIENISKAVKDGFGAGSNNQSKGLEHKLEATNGLLYNMGYIVGALKEKVKQLYTYVSGKVLSALDKVKVKMEVIGEAINTFLLNNFGIDLKKKLEEAKTKFKELFEGLSVFGKYEKSFSGAWKAITEGFSKGKADDIKGTTTELQKADGILYNLSYTIGNFKTKVTTLYEEIKTKLTTAFTTLKTKVIEIGNTLDQFFVKYLGVSPKMYINKFINYFKDLREKGFQDGSTKLIDDIKKQFNAMKDRLNGYVELLKSYGKQVEEKLKPIWDHISAPIKEGFAKIEEAFNTKDFSGLKSLLDKGLLVLLTVGIFKFFSGINNVSRVAPSAMKAISKTFEALSKGAAVLQTGVRVVLIQAISGALLSLAAAVIALSMVPSDKLKLVLLGVGGFITSLIILVKALSDTKLNPDTVWGISKVIMSVSLGLLAMGAAMALVSKANLQGILVVGLATLGIVLAFLYGVKKFSAKSGDILIDIDKYTDKTKNITKTASFKILAVITALTAIALAVANLSNVTSSGGNLLQGLGAMAVILLSILGTIGLLNVIDKHLGSETQTASIFKMVAIIGSLALAVRLISKSVTEISALDPKGVGNALGILVTFFGGITAFSYVLKSSEKQIASVAISVLGISAGFLLITEGIKVLANLDPNTIDKGLGTMVTVLVSLGLFISVLKNFAKNSVGLGVAAAGVGIALYGFAQSCTIIANTNITTMLKTFSAMAAIMIAMGVLTKLLPKSKGDMLLFSAAIVSTAASLLILAKAMQMMENIGAEKIAVNLLGMSGFVIAIAAAMKILDSVKWKTVLTGAAAIAIIATSLTTLTTAIAGLALLNSGKVLASSAAMSGVLLAIAGTIHLVAWFSPKDLLRTAAAIVALGTVVALIAGSIAAVAITDGDYKSIAVAIGSLLAIVSAATVGLLWISDKLGGAQFKSILPIIAMLGTMSVAVLSIAGALNMLGQIPVDRLTAASIAMVGVFTAISIVMGILGHLAINPAFAAGLFAVAGSIAAVAAAFGLLAGGAGLLFIGLGQLVPVFDYFMKLDIKGFEKQMVGLLKTLTKHFILFGAVSAMSPGIIATAGSVSALAGAIMLTAMAMKKVFQVKMLWDKYKKNGKYDESVAKEMADIREEAAQPVQTGPVYSGGYNQASYANAGAQAGNTYNKSFAQITTAKDVNVKAGAEAGLMTASAYMDNMKKGIDLEAFGFTNDMTKSFQNVIDEENLGLSMGVTTVLDEETLKKQMAEMSSSFNTNLFEGLTTDPRLGKLFNTSSVNKQAQSISGFTGSQNQTSPYYNSQSTGNVTNLTVNNITRKGATQNEAYRQANTLYGSIKAQNAMN